MKRRIAALSVTLFLITGFLGGCSFPLKPVIVPSPTRYRAEFENHWIYQTLTPELQACYGSLYTGLTEGFEKDHWVLLEQDEKNNTQRLGISVELPHSLSSLEEAQTLYDAFSRDNPQFFYLDNAFSIKGYQEKDRLVYNSLILAYTMDARQRSESRQKINQAINTILADMPVGADPFEAELLLHDRLAQLCSYDRKAASSGFSEYPDAYTAYGALVNGKAVCEGYSRAMQLLLYRVGIDCTVVRGNARGENHMWNQLRLDGKPYFLDVTWDDAEDILSHYYFNVTSKQLSSSHTPDDGLPGVEECTATEQNYYRRTGRYVDTYHRQTIAQVIAQALQETPGRAEIRLAPKKYHNAALFLQNQTETLRLVNEALPKGCHPLKRYKLYGDDQQNVLLLITDDT